MPHQTVSLSHRSPNSDDQFPSASIGGQSQAKHGAAPFPYGFSRHLDD